MKEYKMMKDMAQNRSVWHMKTKVGTSLLYMAEAYRYEGEKCLIDNARKMRRTTDTYTVQQGVAP